MDDHRHSADHDCDGSWVEREALARAAGTPLPKRGGRRPEQDMPSADEVRSAMALLYLEQPDIAIAEVAYLLGFADQSTFNRAFKRWTGKTPARSRAILSR